jgi:hypothetical protein
VSLLKADSVYNKVHIPVVFPFILHPQPRVFQAADSQFSENVDEFYSSCSIITQAVVFAVIDFVSVIKTYSCNQHVLVKA